ncbi:MAG TPA: hypothetical protein VEK57_18595 [Thermoanaerobaculia bacterium]|nr:hypothetical protein [Thermoanaerobaculia bacterium]
MRRAQALLAALLLFVASTAHANTYVRYYHYYDDAAFTDYIGTSYTNCLGSCASGCSITGPYRIFEKEDCQTLEIIYTACQQWTGSGWVNISCP